MRYLTQIVFLLVLVVLSSCRKDEFTQNNPPDTPEPPCDTTWIDISTFDTIYPNEYLAYWPGSWWEYDYFNVFTDQATIWKKVAKISTEENLNCTTVYIDTVIAPVVNIQVPFNEINGPFLGNRLLKDGIPSTYDNYWSEANLDVEWVVRSYNQGSGDQVSTVTFYRKKIEHIDSMTVTAGTFHDIFKVNCVKVQHFHYGPPFGPSYHQRLYYAKDVGLIRFESGYYTIQDTFDLVNYYIAPH